ncbi:hypothetical protein BC829DRAFT_269644 [Chytridium lagenaria]|nr:hypothetical protein BC829DRAFT_269644 [Chytridium lagenaria]
MQVLASEIIHSIEYVSGVPLHLGTGRAKSSGDNVTTSKELADLKYLYNEIMLTNDELRKENEALRVKLEKSGVKASEDANHTAAMQTEMKQLQEAINILTQEKEELSEKLYPSKPKASESNIFGTAQPPPAPIAVGPLPKIEVPDPTVALMPLMWTKVPPVSSIPVCGSMLSTKSTLATAP